MRGAAGTCARKSSQCLVGALEASHGGDGQQRNRWSLGSPAVKNQFARKVTVPLEVSAQTMSSGQTSSPPPAEVTPYRDGPRLGFPYPRGLSISLCIPSLDRLRNARTTCDAFRFGALPDGFYMCHCRVPSNASANRFKSSYVA
jgi:hypothetical protein